MLLAETEPYHVKSITALVWALIVRLLRIHWQDIRSEYVC